MRRLLCLLAIPGLLAAQITQVEVGAPTLAYIFDNEAGALRTIEGVPGAATVGPVVNAGLNLRNARVAPGRNYAIAETDGGSVLVRLDGRSGLAQPFGVAANAVVGFSPSGSALAWAADDVIEVWAGIPEQPRVVTSRSLQGLKAERIAVSDDGLAVVVLASGNLFRPSGEAWEPFGTDAVTAMEFLRNGHDLLAAGSRLALWHKTTGDLVEEELSSLEAASAVLSTSANERWVVLVSGEVLRLWDRTSGTFREGGSVAGANIGRATGEAVFLVTGSRGENWLVAAEAAVPELLPVGRNNQ